MFEREHYKISEVAEILGCSVEDILDAGSRWQVKIWVWANSWSEGPAQAFEYSSTETPGKLINGPRQLTPGEIHQIRFGYQLEDSIGVYVSDEGAIKTTLIEVRDADKIRIENLILLKEEVESLKGRMYSRDKDELSDSELSQHMDDTNSIGRISTDDRYNIWAKTVREMQEAAENHIARDDLRKMALRAAKKLLQDHDLTSLDRDPFYDDYYGTNKTPDSKKLGETIRTTLTREKLFNRKSRK